MKYILFSFSPNEVDGINDTAFIICSSGTTNKPKGFCKQGKVEKQSGFSNDFK